MNWYVCMYVKVTMYFRRYVEEKEEKSLRSLIEARADLKTRGKGGGVAGGMLVYTYNLVFR